MEDQGGNFWEVASVAGSIAAVLAAGVLAVFTYRLSRDQTKLSEEQTSQARKQIELEERQTELAEWQHAQSQRDRVQADEAKLHADVQLGHHWTGPPPDPNVSYWVIRNRGPADATDIVVAFVRAARPIKQVLPLPSGGPWEVADLAAGQSVREQVKLGKNFFPITMHVGWSDGAGFREREFTIAWDQQPPESEWQRGFRIPDE